MFDSSCLRELGVRLQIFNPSTMQLPWHLLTSFISEWPVRKFLVLELLRISVNLRRVKICMVTDESDDPESSVPLVHNHLQSLSSLGDNILDCLTIPALRDLDTFHETLDESLVSMIPRSGCTIDSLHLWFGYNSSQFHPLQFLLAIPSLTELRMTVPTWAPIDAMLHDLSATDVNGLVLVPNLRSLSIRFDGMASGGFKTRAILDLLLTRKRSLQSALITQPMPYESEGVIEVIQHRRILRALVSEGMNVSISWLPLYDSEFVML